MVSPLKDSIVSTKLAWSESWRSLEALVCGRDWHACLAHRFWALKLARPHGLPSWSSRQIAPANTGAGIGRVNASKSSVSWRCGLGHRRQQVSYEGLLSSGKQVNRDKYSGFRIHPGTPEDFRAARRPPWRRRVMSSPGFTSSVDYLSLPAPFEDRRHVWPLPKPQHSPARPAPSSMRPIA